MYQHILCVFVTWDITGMIPHQTKWPFLAGLEDCSECKLYPFIYAYQFDKYKFSILNKIIISFAY